MHAKNLGIGGQGGVGYTMCIDGLLPKSQPVKFCDSRFDYFCVGVDILHFNKLVSGVPQLLVLY